jgi:16S rRNA processing protein RimM
MLTELDPVELPKDAVEVGRIGEAWGIKGWFKVAAHSSKPEALFSSKRWYLRPAERGARNFAGTVLLRLIDVKDHAGGVVASAYTIADRSTAELLRGASVFVSRSSFPSTGTNEYYWVDLIGLVVVNREGLFLGQVKEILSTTAQAVLVMEFNQDGKLQERMIPFVTVYVDDVDLAAGVIKVNWHPDY